MADEEIKISFTETVHEESEKGAVADGKMPAVPVAYERPAFELARSEQKRQEPREKRGMQGDRREPENLIAVRFRQGGKASYFDAGELSVRSGMHVIAETARGMEYGAVTGVPAALRLCRFRQPVRRILRIATPEDDARNRENREKERTAYLACQEKIRQHALEMKLIAAEYTFDGSKIMFYFTADGRIDFRDLVKDLAGGFRTRIELRQIGVRDETKMLGGYGVCGRPLCCASYLSDFVPVSIKMAKEQSLSLNPAKISGVCGRLMCCLKNEEDVYEELNRNLPGVGDEVEGNDGLVGEVSGVDVLRQRIRILVEINDEKELHEYGVGEFTILRRRRRGSSRSAQGSRGRRPAEEAKEKEHAAPARREGGKREHGRPAGTRAETSDRPAAAETGTPDRPGTAPEHEHGGTRHRGRRPHHGNRPLKNPEAGGNAKSGGENHG
ncbi:PSP1 domain-containing protein [Lachnoclostridium sp. Marseille-P6806]|uniref:PSP1 domain-containing protein n=1 Tax=Lachnoclostridium sp. Marseille-P6806 TaxID=2364793 RepID=UPI002ED25001